MVIFRENTRTSTRPRGGGRDARGGEVIETLHESFVWDIRPDSGIGIKPVSETGSKA